MALWFELGVASVVRPEFRNPAGLLPKLDVVPVCQGLRLFFRGLVVGAHQLNAFNKVAIRPDKVCSIFRHGGTPTAFSPVKLKQMIVPVSVRFPTHDR
jgi:hypothetical protein